MSLPTIAQFQEAERNFRRRALVIFGFTGAAMLGVMGIAAVLKNYLDGPETSVWVAFLPMFFFLCSLPLFFFGIVRTESQFRKFPTLICRHCGKNLAHHPTIVIATRNCPHCGCQVVCHPVEPSSDASE